MSDFEVVPVGTRQAIREAYIALTTGDMVSRAYNAQMILEEVEGNCIEEDVSV